MENVPEWLQNKYQKDADSLKEEQCADSNIAYICAWKLYPFNPFYMRGPDYYPTDLNKENREVFVKGFNLGRESV